MAVKYKVMNHALSVMIVSFFVLAISCSTCYAAGTTGSGECGDNGDNVVWTLDSNKTLTIS